VKTRNEHAFARRHRAGNAGSAVSVDTRPKSVPSKKRYCRKKAKAALKRANHG